MFFLRDNRQPDRNFWCWLLGHDFRKPATGLWPWEAVRCRKCGEVQR